MKYPDGYIQERPLDPPEPPREDDTDIDAEIKYDDPNWGKKHPDGLIDTLEDIARTKI